MKSNSKSILDFFYSKNYFIASTYLMSFTFALTPFLSSMSLIIFSFFGLFQFQKMSKINLRGILLFSFIFFLYLISLFFTPETDRALQLIIRISPVFLIPIVIYFTKIYLKINYNTLKLYFIAGVAISCIISIIVGLIKCLIYKDMQYLFYYELGYFFHIHPTYYALFVIVAFHFSINNQYLVFKKNRGYILTLFFIFIFLLQSKIALIVLLLYLGIRLIKLNKKKAIKVFFAVLALSSILFYISSRLDSNRFSELIKSRATIEIGNDSEDGIYQRLWLWHEAKEQIEEKLWFGYGVGSQNTIFNWKVEKKLLSSQNSHTYLRAAKNISKLNLHNQYLQIFYELGIIGGILFLLSIFLVILRALKTNKTDFLFVYFFFLIFMLTENLLERQMGIYFYAFTLSLLYFEKEVPVCNKK